MKPTENWEISQSVQRKGNGKPLTQAEQEAIVNRDPEALIAARECIRDGVRFDQLVRMLQGWAHEHGFVFIEAEPHGKWFFMDKRPGTEGIQLPDQPDFPSAIQFILEECERRALEQQTNG